MNHLDITLDEWIFKLKNNPTLRTAIGVAKNNIPSASSHYDFINRLIKIDESPQVKLKKLSPAKNMVRTSKCQIDILKFYKD